MRDPLSILFGSQARVKLLRFFLFNPSKEFEFDDLARRAKLVRRTARTEMNALERAGVIKKKKITIMPDGEGGRTKRADGYMLDTTFPELEALQRFLFETAPINGRTVLKHLRKAGVLDFVALSGVFVRDFEHRIDMLVAMKKLNEQKIGVALRALEAEIGIEIRFAALSSEDLMYRIGMQDKLIRDVFDYRHEILVDKIGVYDAFRSGA